LSILIEDIQGI